VTRLESTWTDDMRGLMVNHVIEWVKYFYKCIDK